MAYLLGIRKKQEFIPIDIKNLPNFIKKSNFKIGYSLDEIDLLTSNYKNEIELKKDLFTNGLIDFDLIDYELIIVKKQKEEYPKIMYGLFFNDGLKYLDIEFLKYNLLSKSCDYEFLKKFINHYRSNYNAVILNIISSLMADNTSSEYIGERLYEFFQKEIYSYNKETKTFSIKYKSLHDMAMFIYLYDYNKYLDQNEIKKEDKKKKLSRLKEELISLNSPKIEETKVKTRRKKKITPLDGQLSFEDII